MARRKSTQARDATRLILDSGAVIALARGERRARAFLGRAVEEGTEVLVPAVVVAETIRGHGPRDAAFNRVLAAIDSVLPADDAVARTAGRLLGAASSAETIDALVVATAIHAGGGGILTGDPADLRPLARGEPQISVHEV